MQRKHSAFSLIELLIALAILAAVTTIALRSLDGLQSQARYQQTTRQLDEIRNAIVGPVNQHGPDGSTIVSGFVADTGRLPNFLVSINDPLGSANGDPLNELLERPISIPQFAFVSSSSDSTIKIGAGWQGPYLRLGSGPTYIRDGWGVSFHCYDISGNAVITPGVSISQVSSWGADHIADSNHGGSADTSGYNGDVSSPYANNLITGGYIYKATLFGHISMNIGADSSITTGPTPNPKYVGNDISIWVCYFGPKSDGTVVEVFQKIADSLPSGNPAWTSAVANGFEFTLNNASITIGPRVVRAYVLHTGASFNATAVSSAYVVTPPMNLNIVGGLQTIPNLVLPHYAP